MVVENNEEIELMPAEYYMRECFELAKSALGGTSPNPAVGAVVVDKNGLVVGKGYHHKASLEHAEVLALKQAGKKAEGGTLIVNLEPCCHFGKTPPCTDLIIKSKINEVIFSAYDPNPLVSGKGEKILKENNIKTVSGILESEGLELNKFFLKWIKTKLPWVTLKQAQTLDGKIAIKSGDSKWITSESSRKEVHHLRSLYDAVLVGANTVSIDNPQLTVRDVASGRNPARVIIDLKLITKPDSNVYKDNARVFLVTKKGYADNALKAYLSFNKNIEVIALDEVKPGRIDFKELFQDLAKKDILSVFVEAGPLLAGEVILSGLVNEYLLFIAPMVFGDESAISSLKLQPINTLSQSICFQIYDYKKIGNDLMVSLRPR